MNYLKNLTIACLLTSFGIGTTATSAAPATHRTAVLPQLEMSGDFLRVADKMTAEQEKEAKELEARVNGSIERLQKDEAFLAALGKRDTETVARMIQKDAKTDAPIRLKIDGEGEPVPGKIRWWINIKCCPLKISGGIEF